MCSGETPTTCSYGNINTQKAKNVGMLREHAHLFFPPQVNECAKKKVEEKLEPQILKKNVATEEP